MVAYVRLLRLKHWIKNGLLWIPLFMNVQRWQGTVLVQLMLSFVAFSLLASMVYVLNDFHDKAEDAKHPLKKNRPFPSGQVKTTVAGWLCLGLLVGAVALLRLVYLATGQPLVWILPLLYVLNNLLYVYKLRGLPFWDVSSIGLGFVLRLSLGSVVAGVVLSPWLGLSVFGFACYMGYSKRQGEFQLRDRRPVLARYGREQLHLATYLSLGVGIGAYGLWALSSRYSLLVVSTLLIILPVSYRYDALFKQVDHPDPTLILLADKRLQGLCLLYLAMLVVIFNH